MKETKLNEKENMIYMSLKENASDNGLLLLKVFKKKLKTMNSESKDLVIEDISSYLNAGITDLNGYINYLVSRDFSDFGKAATGE